VGAGGGGEDSSKLTVSLIWIISAISSLVSTISLCRDRIFEKNNRPKNIQIAKKIAKKVAKKNLLIFISAGGGGEDSSNLTVSLIWIVSAVSSLVSTISLCRDRIFEKNNRLKNIQIAKKVAKKIKNNLCGDIWGFEKDDRIKIDIFINIIAKKMNKNNLFIFISFR
jgi:adenylylsulfate kinase-like enzyme